MSALPGPPRLSSPRLATIFTLLLLGAAFWANSLVESPPRTPFPGAASTGKAPVGPSVPEVPTKPMLAGPVAPERAIGRYRPTEADRERRKAAVLQVPFQAEVWAKASPAERFHMVVDLIAVGDPVGKGADEIEGLLGPLVWGRELGGGRIRYTYALDPPGILASDALVLEFDREERLISIGLTHPEDYERLLFDLGEIEAAKAR